MTGTAGQASSHMRNPEQLRTQMSSAVEKIRCPSAVYDVAVWFAALRPERANESTGGANAFPESQPERPTLNTHILAG
jgi:hypothetical protein